MLEKLDLTYPQYIVMMGLWEKKEATVQQIHNCTKIDGGSLTQILKKLSTKGYITLTPTKEDKRVKVVSLSPEGEKLQTVAASVPEQMVCKFKGLDPQDFEDLKKILDKINAELE